MILNDPCHMAIHEAGHAVIGRVLGLSCGSATIRVNETEGEAGHAIIDDPMITANDWDRRFLQQMDQGLSPMRYHEVRAAYRGTILARMAGAEAENEILGACEGGDARDRYEIERLAESSDTDISEEAWPRYEPRMRRQTKRLIRKHNSKIERVAAALLERRELSGPEIDSIVLACDKAQVCS